MDADIENATNDRQRSRGHRGDTVTQIQLFDDSSSLVTLSHSRPAYTWLFKVLMQAPTRSDAHALPSPSVHSRIESFQ
jgi:hypothetical protein